MPAGSPRRRRDEETGLQSLCRCGHAQLRIPGEQPQLRQIAAEADRECEVPEVGTPETVTVGERGDKLGVRGGGEPLPRSGGKIRPDLEQFFLDEQAVPAHPGEHRVRLGKRERGDQVVARGAKSPERFPGVTLMHEGGEHRR